MVLCITMIRKTPGVRDIGSVNIAPWGAGERDGRNGASKVIVDIPNVSAPSDAPLTLLYIQRTIDTIPSAVFCYGSIQSN